MAENKYFDYVTGKNREGEAYAHRTNVQKWIVNTAGSGQLTIFVQGPLPDGAYNAFAKKHLMTTAGGANDGSPKGKLTNVSENRRKDGLASVLAARQEKLDAMKEFAPKHAIQYNADNAYGAKGIGFNTPLTMVHCDATTPAKLKEAFAKAILAIKDYDTQGVVKVGHVNVVFSQDIVYNQLFSRNDITVTNRMSVAVMRDRLINTFHVFHGDQYDPAYPSSIM